MKGIGLIQALSVIEAAGYKLINLATTFAAAIVAALFDASSTATSLSMVAHRVSITVSFFLTLMRNMCVTKGNYPFRSCILPKHAEDPRYRFTL